MTKKALKSAIWVGIAITISGVLPRLLSPQLYNDTYPPILIQALIHFVAGFVVCFLVYLLIENVKSKSKNEKR